MNDRYLSTALLASALLGASLASACSSDATRSHDANNVAVDSEPAAPVLASAKVSPPAAPGDRYADRTAEPVVQSAGKGGAPVRLGWQVDGKPQAGVPLTVDLELMPTSVVSDLRVEVSAGRGLEAVRGHGDLSLTRRAKSGGYEHRVVVTPLEDGLAYINVIATVQTPAGPQMRSFAVPVTTGDGGATIKRKAAGQIETDRNGDRVRVLPAREDSGG